MANSEARCAVARAMRVIGERWAILILREAFYGHTRFDDFEREIGLASNILSARLKKLVDAGLLERRGSAKRPTYHLTDSGAAFFPAYVALKSWADDWFLAGEEPMVRMYDSVSGAEIKARPVARDDGSLIQYGDVSFVRRIVDKPSQTESMDED
jgi:DNA-binding HxlR family transcriptional regulator